MTEEEMRARVAELEAKDELTDEEKAELEDLKSKLKMDEGGSTPSSLNIGG